MAFDILAARRLAASSMTLTRLLFRFGRAALACAALTASGVGPCRSTM
ncbi:hypothetical protein [Caulobacter sp. NIBR1757]|nr:hypothetical protein [Caulobacter sp. NIBR1757]